MTSPVGLASDHEYVGLVAEAVEQRGGELLVAEALDPLGELEVGVDGRGAPLVAVGEQDEEQSAVGPLEGHEAEFGDDQQGNAHVALMQAGERVFVVRLDQLADEIGGADEGDPLVPLDGVDPERDRATGLARPTGSGIATSSSRSMWLQAGLSGR